MNTVLDLFKFLCIRKKWWLLPIALLLLMLGIVLYIAVSGPAGLFIYTLS